MKVTQSYETPRVDCTDTQTGHLEYSLFSLPDGTGHRLLRIDGATGNLHVLKTSAGGTAAVWERIEHPKTA